MVYGGPHWDRIAWNSSTQLTTDCSEQLFAIDNPLWNSRGHDGGWRRANCRNARFSEHVENMLFTMFKNLGKTKKAKKKKTAYPIGAQKSRKKKQKNRKQQTPWSFAQLWELSMGSAVFVFSFFFSFFSRFWPASQNDKNLEKTKKTKKPKRQTPWSFAQLWELSMGSAVLFFLFSRGVFFNFPKWKTTQGNQKE